MAAVLIVPALPVIAAGPAYAADHVICVGNPAGPCDATEDSISAAIAVAGGNALDDTIFVGPGTYSEIPYVLNGSVHGLTLKGSGPTTVLTLPANAVSQDYVVANHATVRDLTVTLEPTTPSNDKAIFAFAGSVVDNVTVVGAGTTNATGMETINSRVIGSSIMMPVAASSRGMFAEGGTTVTDTTITADNGVVHSGTGTPDTLSRTTIHVGSGAGVSTDSGTVNIDNSVIDLGTTGSTGLRAANFNNSITPRAINADHVTIVGGNGSSKGVWAYAATAGALQTTAVTLANSIVRGPVTSLVADASNNGSQGGPSTATLGVTYTNYQTTGGTIDPVTGAGGITPGAGNLNVDPDFVNAAGGNYHLSQGSPVIDKGNPEAGLPEDTDRGGAARVVDGDGNGSAIRDMGAYEFADLIPPQTTITGGPTGPTRDTTPTFAFTSEPGASFACQIDAGPYGACSSPFTAPALANGVHTFRVRATDAANNIATAVRSFKVDTIAPQTTITKKPAKQITTRRARFAFTSSEAGSRFQCRVDAGAWKACSSPKVLRVKKGRHIFRVRAIDLAGNVDASPAPFRFRRV